MKMGIDAFWPELAVRSSGQNFSVYELFIQLDNDTRQHCYRVSQLAGQLGRAFGLETHEISLLETAALFHDIGKIAIDKTILSKPTLLTASEREMVRLHPEMGAQIWLELGGPYSISETILCHHEAFDGSGYPFGLAGDDIPLHARMVTLADALDAMLSSRNYSAPLTIDDAIRIISNLSGKQFDPLLVDLLLIELEYDYDPAEGIELVR
ncbi:MAG TPA: HD domain-containing protein [Bacteroidetes bacterium]|nr:HD domain-containing protein [Bacteroidota bacterium]